MPTTEGLPALARPAARHLVCGALTLPPHSRRVAPVRSEVPGAVSLEDFRSLKDRLQPMPRNTPLDGEWQRMLDKETSVMTYKAWRHNLPVRGTPCPLRRPGGTQSGGARFGQLRPRAVRRGKVCTRCRRAFKCFLHRVAAGRPGGAERAPPLDRSLPQRISN